MQMALPAGGPPRARQVLRDYQRAGLEEVARLEAGGARKVLVSIPTGGGKTSLFSEYIERAVAAGDGVVVLAHRKELIGQASRRLDGQGIPHGVIMGNHPRWMPWLPVQVASVQTFSPRLRRGLLKPPKRYVVDEAHRSLAESYATLLNADERPRVLGVTATPWTDGGRGMGRMYEALVAPVTARELRDRGYLVPVTGFAYAKPDVSHVRRVANDYDKSQLAAVMMETKLLGGVVAEWLAHARGLRTVAFAVNVAHSKKLVEEFRAAGVRAEHVDADTLDDRRRDVLAQLDRGDIDVLSNVGVFTEGWDCPRVECGILAKPTQSLVLYMQMVGRLLRRCCLSCAADVDWREPTCASCGSSSVKRCARLHDHANNVYTHGNPYADRDMSLEYVPRRRRRASEEEAATVRTCMAILPGGAICFCLYDPAEHEVCPACGFDNRGLRVVREVEAVATPIEEVAPEAETPARELDFEQGKRKLEYLRLVAIALKTGKDPRWANRAYARVFRGEWPDFNWMREAGVV